MTIFSSALPNDQDLIRALGPGTIPMPLFTDVAFIGKGDNDTSILIAIERKKPGDLAQSLQDGRLVAQFQKCKENDADVIVLILEGRYHRNIDDGTLEIPVWGISPRTGNRAAHWVAVKPTMQFSRFDQFLTELQYLAGVIVKRTEGVRGTADVIQNLYTLFTKAPSEHQSFKQFYSSPPLRVPLVRPSLLRRMAKELDGVGWDIALGVEEHFTSVQEMVNADEKAWRAVPGIGKKIAKGVVQLLQNNNTAQRGGDASQ